MEMSIYNGPLDLKVGSTQVYQVVKDRKQVWPPLTTIDLSNFSSNKIIKSTKLPAKPYFKITGNASSITFNNSVDNIYTPFYTLTDYVGEYLDVVNTQLLDIYFEVDGNAPSNTAVYDFYETIEYDLNDVELIYANYWNASEPTWSNLSIIATYNGEPLDTLINCCIIIRYWQATLAFKGDDLYKLAEQAVRNYYSKMGDGYRQPSDWEINQVTFTIYNSNINNVFNSNNYSNYMFFDNENGNSIPTFSSNSYIYYPRGTDVPDTEITDFITVYTADVNNVDFYKPNYIPSGKFYMMPNVFSMSYSTTYSLSSGPGGYKTITFPSQNAGDKNFGYISNNKLYVADHTKLPDLPPIGTYTYSLNAATIPSTLIYDSTKLNTIPYTFNAYLNKVYTAGVNYPDKEDTYTNLYNPKQYKSSSTNPILVTHKYDINNQQSISSINDSNYVWELKNGSITADLSVTSGTISYPNIQGEDKTRIYYVCAMPPSCTPGAQTWGIYFSGENSKWWGNRSTTSPTYMRADFWKNNLTSYERAFFYNTNYNLNCWNHTFTNNSGVYPTHIGYATTTNTTVKVSNININNTTKLLCKGFAMDYYRWNDLFGRGTRLTLQDAETISVLEALGTPTSKDLTRTLPVWMFFVTGDGGKYTSTGFTYLGTVTVKSVTATKSLIYTN